MSEIGPVTIVDVLDARRRIAPYLDPTPLMEATSLSERLEARVFLKLECLLPTRAFKVRGGVNLVRKETLAGALPKAGIVAASTGNHGQSIAYAGRAFGVPVAIFAPEGANPAKVQAMQRLGATLHLTGADFDDAREHAEAYAREIRGRYVHSMEEPLLIAGVATAYLELLEALPEIDVVIVPVGGGSGLSGAGTVLKALKPTLRVLGVQAEGAPAVYRSFRSGRAEATPAAATAAEGLATRVAFPYPLGIIRRTVDDIILVSDDEMRSAQALLVEAARIVPEMAGAASTAAALKIAPTLRGKTVALTVSGANASLEELSRIPGLGSRRS